VNGPLTVEAEEILMKRGILVFPDILVNVGSVTASYFEWLQNLDFVNPARLMRRWEERSNRIFLKAVMKKLKIKEELGEEIQSDLMREPMLIDIVHSGLEEIVCAAVDETRETAKRLNVSLRVAGYVNAIRKIDKCYEDAGIVVRNVV